MIKNYIKNNVYLLFAFLFFCGMLFSQNSETDNWYFGIEAGVNFETPNNPQVLVDSKMKAPSGSATISDIDGNLQFYTYGDWVWNKNHQLMDNGDLVELTPSDIGNNFFYQTYKDASQNSIIIPIIDIEGLYYIFTVGRSHEDLVTPDGLYYSLVDMNLNNGLGAVIDKNRTLIPSQSITGKISAVHHSDGKSIWVMITKKNIDNPYTSFYAYKVNTDGSIEPPVISSDQLFFKGIPNGILKFSPDGKKVACSNEQPEGLNDHLSIFNFNNETGLVSERKTLFTSTVFFEVISVHGIAFSNDSKYLYASLVRQGSLDTSTGTVVNSDNIYKKLLYQYNLADINPWTNSTLIHEDIGDFTGGALQLSKNGKIYRALPKSNSAGTNYIGVIDNPSEIVSETDYLHNNLDLNGKVSRLGLPNFIQSYFRTRILAVEECLNNPVFFEVDTYAQITAAEWDFGDGNISNEITPNHVFDASGSYDVSVTITVNNRQITTSKMIIIHGLPDLNDDQELIQCDSNTDGISMFNLNTIRDKITNPDLSEELIFYETLTDAEQDSNRILDPTNYTNYIIDQEIFVRVVNENNCWSINSFFLKTVFSEPRNISDIVVCDDSDSVLGDSIGYFNLNEIQEGIRNELGLLNSFSISLHPTQFDAQTSQNNLRSAYFTESTIIWVRLEGSDSMCDSISPLSLIVNPNPEINIDDNYFLCGDETLIVSGLVSNDRFEWLDSNNSIVSTSRHFSPTEVGVYTHIAYISQNGVECSNSKVFTINRVAPPVFHSIEISEGSNINTVFVDVIGDSTYEFSINGTDYYGSSNNYTFENVSFGIYTIFVRDKDGCEPPIQEKIHIIGFPKFFTPNGDGINDFWIIKGLDFASFESIIIFNRYGKRIINLNHQNAFSWNGKYKGKKLPANDYWFEVLLKNGEKRVGHFTLKW